MEHQQKGKVFTAASCQNLRSIFHSAVGKVPSMEKRIAIVFLTPSNRPEPQELLNTPDLSTVLERVRVVDVVTGRCAWVVVIDPGARISSCSV